MFWPARWIGDLNSDIRGYWPKIGQELTRPRQQRKREQNTTKGLCGGKVGNVLVSALLCFDFVEKLP